jgi:hypothetical protein
MNMRLVEYKPEIGRMSAGAISALKLALHALRRTSSDLMVLRMLMFLMEAVMLSMKTEKVLMSGRSY